MIAATTLALALAGSFSAVPERTWDGMPEPAFVGGGVLEAPALATPWMCEQTEWCTQGHNGGSHTGSSAWAWDFSHQEGEEIWAASAGTVSHVRMDSTAGGCSTDYINDANYVVVDHGDGTSIVYLHVLPNSSPLQVGETVEVGDLVARVGATGYACGAHLHLMVMETCGGSYCNSLMASFTDHGDPAPDTQYTSTNCPACGKALAGGETVIDDEDAGCFVRVTTAWSSAYDGENGHHFVTRATDSGAADSIGSWRFTVTTPGDYHVEVFVPDAEAGTTNAVYEIVHAAGMDAVAIDQSTQKGWQEIGVFGFAGGGGELVRLPDNTGESLDLQVPIAYDAMRFTYVPSSGSESGDVETMGDPTDGGTSAGTESSGGGTSDGSTGGPGSSTRGTEETSGGSLASNALPPGGATDDEGCACTSAGPGPWSVAWLLALAFVRRRFARRTGTFDTVAQTCGHADASRQPPAQRLHE